MKRPVTWSCEILLEEEKNLRIGEIVYDSRHFSIGEVVKYPRSGEILEVVSPVHKFSPGGCEMNDRGEKR